MIEEKIVVVGMGQYGIELLEPTLAMLKKEMRAEVIATVDIIDRPNADCYTEVEHRNRHPDQDLSDLLSDLKNMDPIVILGHSNDCHAPDAISLLDNNYRVMIEKPFAISVAELDMLQGCIERHPSNAVLLEYYLMMKSAPVLIAAGLINPCNFYDEKVGVINTVGKIAGQGWENIHNKLEELIGRPLAIYLDILEGEKKERGTGRVDHRGQYLVDLRKGGGMLQDLGVHGLSILFALEGYIGVIDPEFSNGIVRVARSREYLDYAENLGIDDIFIGESYAELDFTTAIGVPVSVRVGKYVLDNKNQRRLIIVGDQGVLHHDLSTCQLAIHQGDRSLGVLLEAPKLPDSKYYPVIRAGLELLQNNSLYQGFDPTTAALNAQKLVLFALRKAYQMG